MAEQRINQHLALEMTMQEVLGSLEELALDFGFSDGEACFEILAIEAPVETNNPPPPPSSAHMRSPLMTAAHSLTQQKQRNVA
jgi:hypothetical protein